MKSGCRREEIGSPSSAGSFSFSVTPKLSSEFRFRCSEVVGPDKCQRRGRLGRGFLKVTDLNFLPWLLKTAQNCARLLHCPREVAMSEMSDAVAEGIWKFVFTAALGIGAVYVVIAIGPFL